MASTTEGDEVTQTCDSVKTLLSSRDKFLTIWKNLGQSFWIKFITNLRYSPDIIDSKYSPNEFDYIFVDVLKNLVAKKFGKMFDYIVNWQKLNEYQIDLGQLLEASFLQTRTKEQKAEYYKMFKIVFGENYTDIHTEKIKYIFKIQGKITKLVIEVLNSQKTRCQNFQIPASWCQSDCTAGPYEMFLRARWGGDLAKILDVPKEDLKWWHAPAVSMTKPSLSQPFNGALKLIYETPCKWLPALSDYPPFSMSIINNATQTLDFFDRLKLLKVPIYMWDLIELSVPPVLAQKFYLGRGGALVEDDDEHHYLAVCPWFVLWQNSFGIEFLNVLQSMHSEYDQKGIYSKDNDVTWEERMIEYKKVLTTALSKYGAPYKIEECAEDPEEFLREACFIIQLSYSPTLLQQWLAAALIEVMKFELASLELRHFPVPIEIEEFARNILIFIRQLKERILLGICLLSRQVNMHPEFDTKYPAMLMDEVVIPSIPGLEMLTTGRAGAALDHFKTIAWSQSRSSSECELVLVPATAYSVHPELENIYTHHVWHLRYWLQNKLSEPFPAKVCDGLDLNVLINEIKYDGHERIPSTKFKTHKYSTEERLLFADRQVELNKVQPNYVLQNARYFIENEIKQEYLSQFTGDTSDLLIENVKDFVLNDDIDRLSPEHQILQCATVLNDLSSTMTNMEKNPSWLSWVVRLSGEIIKKEQLVRIASACFLITKQTPIVFTPIYSHTCKTTEMIEVIKFALYEQRNRDRTWLEEEFPQLWRNPILSPSLQLNPEEHRTLGDIVQTMEDRVGRLIYNVAWKYIREGPESSSKYEALFSAQYLLPCYMSIHFCGSLQIQFFRNPLKCAVLSNFLITVIIRYECYYKIESKKRKGKERYTGIELSQADNISILPQSFCREVLLASERVSKYLYERVIDFFSEYQAFDVIKIMYESMFDWPNYSSSDRELCTVESLVLKAWQIVGTDHLRDARENCRQAWNLPKPGSSLHKKELKAVYVASEVIARLTILTCRFGGDYPGLKTLREFNLLQKMMAILPDWRHELLLRVLKTQNAIGISEHYSTKFTDSDISTFSKNYMDLLSKVLGLMRCCREYLGYTLNTVISPNLGYESSHVTNHILDFNLGNIDNICRALKLKTSCKGEAQTEVDVREMAARYLNITIEPAIATTSGKQTKKSSKKKTIPQALKKEETPGRECSNCHKMETVDNKFLPCQKCLKDKYPNINYFCNETCQATWWEIEHMAEHLEFELGLC